MVGYLRFLSVLWLVQALFSPVSGNDMGNALARMDSLIAESHFEQALEIGQAAFQDNDNLSSFNDTLTARVWDRMAVCHKNQSRLIQADSLWRLSLPIMENAFGLNHIEVVNIYLNLSLNKKLLYRFNKADSLLNYVLTHIRPNNDSLLIAKVKALTRRANLAWELGLHDDAETYCDQAISLSDSAMGKNNCISASSWVTLANIRADKGMILEAEELYLQAIDMCGPTDKKWETNRAYGMYHYARFLHKYGEKTRAIDLFVKILDIYEKNYGTEHPYIVICLIYLAGIYGDLGYYATSETYYERALAIGQSNLGRHHPYIPIILSHLGQVAQQQGLFEKADSLYSHALDLNIQIYGTESTYSCACYSALADINRELNRPIEAEDFARKALDYFNRKCSSDSDGGADGIHALLSMCDEFDSMPDTSQQYYRLLDRFREQEIGWNLGNIAWQLHGIGEMCLLVGMYPEASQFVRYAHRFLQKTIRGSAYLRSDREISLFLNNIYYMLGIYLSSYFAQSNPSTSLSYEAADLILSTRSMTTDILMERHRLSSLEANPPILKLLDSLNNAKAELASIFTNASNQDVAGAADMADSLCRLIEKLEITIAREGFHLECATREVETNTDYLLSSLSSRTGLIAYVNTFYYPAGQSIPKIIYMALVIDPDRQPRIINIGDNKKIDSLMDLYVLHMDRIADQGGVVMDEDVREFKNISNGLYNRVWKPIENYLVDSDLALIIPDFSLNNLSFATLSDDNGAYLVEKKALHYLYSMRGVDRKENSSPSGNGLFAIGATDLDATITADALRTATGSNSSGDSDANSLSNSGWQCEDLADLLLHPLMGARTEMEKVVSVWIDNYDESAVLYIGSEATERSFKKKAPGSRVIHVATHGYLADCWVEEDLEDSRLKDPKPSAFAPMLFSGLFFAEVNNRKDRNSNLESEDGILTAYEVSAMDLSGTDLVILSACESGAGISPTGHEIYGLPLAFRMAGVRSVVSSLWPISDQASPELLTALYQEREGNLPEKLRSIQMEYIKRLRDRKLPDHPANWGALATCGDW